MYVIQVVGQVSKGRKGMIRVKSVEAIRYAALLTYINKQEQREASRPIIRRSPVSRSFFCQCESTAVPLRSRASETFLAVDFVKTIQRFRLRLPNCGLGDVIFCATVKLNTTGLAVVVQKKAGAYFTRTPSRSDMTPANRRRRSLQQ